MAFAIVSLGGIMCFIECAYSLENLVLNKHRTVSLYVAAEW